MPADLLEELYEFAPAGAFIPFGTPVKQDDIPGFSPDSTEGGLYTKQGIGTSQERSQHHTSITVFFLVGEALGAGRERLSLRCSPVASKGERQVPFRTPGYQSKRRETEETVQEHGTGSHSISSSLCGRRRSRTSTTWGSNCDPAQRRSSARAPAGGRAG